MKKTTVIHDQSLLTEQDIYLFKEGSHFRLYNKLGAHLTEQNGQPGVCFAVWAPSAEKVTVIGDFNCWNKKSHPLAPRWDSSGIWEGFIPGLQKGSIYKYFITAKNGRFKKDKGDPFAFAWEVSPKTASVVWDLDYTWNDSEWMEKRRQNNSLSAPISIYEVHLGSWRRVVEENNRSLHYHELAEQLAKYVKEMGFTHVEFLPVMEHPFYGSWGYQKTGYFAPSSRYGTPQNFMYLIDILHQNGIGVILDWVPSHFASDEYGLAYFDGTNLYEHADRRQGYHPDWGSYIFNYGRKEVQNFLISSAMFWLDKYHIDGLRINAVASMLYLDYSRKEGEWIPNVFGGRENLEAISFLKRLNTTVYQNFPDTQTYAEESTAWPMVTKPVHLGGLGFGLKWNMGWMHDSLVYISKEPVHRKFHHDQLTFSLWYAFFENFLLPLSHDEVVHGKGSLINKMPGDNWQKFANLRLLFGYMYMHPGKKLLFMGAEIGQWHEWNHDTSLDWHLLEHDQHRQVQKWVRDLNHYYKQEPALFEVDFDLDGFSWIDCQDHDNSIISFIRRGKSTGTIVLVVCNFTPVPRYNYRLGVPASGFWQETLNSDSHYYGGSNLGNNNLVETDTIASHGYPQSLALTIPPLAMVVLRKD